MKWTDENTQAYPCLHDMDGNGNRFELRDVLALEHKSVDVEAVVGLSDGECMVYLSENLPEREWADVLDEHGYDIISFLYMPTGPPEDPPFPACDVPPVFLRGRDSSEVAREQGWEWYGVHAGYLFCQNDADRYWVGGTGNWSDNTNHWSASSGGAIGASKPANGDNVFIDSNSAGAGFTITVDENTATLNNTSATINTACEIAVGTFTYTSTGSTNWTNPLLSVTTGTIHLGSVTCNNSMLGSNTAYTLDIDGAVTLTAGYLYLPTSAGSFDMSGATWSQAGGMTVEHDGGLMTVSGALALASDATSFNKITLSGANTFTTSASNYALTCASDLVAGNTTCDLNQSTVSVGKLGVQAGCTLTGDNTIAPEITITAGPVGGYAVDNDGVVSADVNLTIAHTGATYLDLNGTGGNFNNLTCNHASLIAQFDGNSTIDGNLTVTAGTYRQKNNAETMTLGGNLSITGTLGHATWTGKLTIGGHMSGAGSYLHGNQECEFNGVATQTVSNDFTFYDLTSASTDLQLDHGITTIVQHTLTIDSGKVLLLRGGTSNTTLTLGTAGASGTLANAGTFRAHVNSGTFSTIIQAANTLSYKALLTGAGTYDWDYGTSNGEVHLSGLVHQGTHASAKTSGGGGVTIKILEECRFDEDWTVAANDTWNQNTKAINVNKDISNAGTIQNPGQLKISGIGTILNWTGLSLYHRSNSAYSFDGTSSFSTTVTWLAGKTGSLLAYDASSILNVTGGITVPASTYFGADSSGDMGDGNAVSTWTADQSWGFLVSAGTATLTAGTTTFTGADGSGMTLDNSGTLTHNSGIIKASGTVAQGIDGGGSDLYRLDNQNTTEDVTFSGTNIDMDAIWYTASTTTDAETITVTLTGITPALGSTGPFTHDALETAGRLSETTGGAFVFDHEVPEYVSESSWRILRGSAQAAQEHIVDATLRVGVCRYPCSADIILDDQTGAVGQAWTIGTLAWFYYHDGTEWILKKKLYAQDREESSSSNPETSISCVGFDHWLRVRKVSQDFSHRDHTLREVLEFVLEKYTPLVYDDSLVDLSSNPSTLRPVWQGVTVEECIEQILGESADEEWFVNNDQTLVVQQRATAHDGTRDAPGTFDEGDLSDYAVYDVGSSEITRSETSFGSALDDMVVSDDSARQTALQSATGAARPVIIEADESRSDETSEARAGTIAQTRLNHRATRWEGKLVSWERYDYDPGQVTEFELPYKADYSAATAAKIYAIEYRMDSDASIFTIQETGTKKPSITAPYLGNSATLTSIDRTNKTAIKADIQRADSSFDLQAETWDTDAEFAAGWEDEAGAKIDGTSTKFAASGNAIIADNGAGDWVGGQTHDVLASSFSPTGSAGRDNVLFWWLVNYVATDNDGTVKVHVEEQTTANESGDLDDWHDLTANLGGTLAGGCVAGTKYRLRIVMTWDGAGSAPSFAFGAIRWK